MASIGVDPACVWQPDMTQALIQALRAVPDRRAEDNEMAGVIYTKNGNYCYSVPHKSNAPDSFDMKVQVPEGASIAGLWHTHPVPGKGRSLDTSDTKFAPHDLEMAERLKVPSFIKFLRDGSVRKYEPGVTPTTGKANNRSSAGDTVTIPPTL